MADSAITFTPAEVSSYYAARVPNLKEPRGGERRGPCPVHGGKDDNFAVNPQTGEAYCHSQCRRGWDILSLEMALTGADFKTALDAVYTTVGHPMPTRAQMNRNGQKERPFKERFETAYDYADERGDLLYQVVRLHSPKDFRQRRPDGKGGWIWKKSPRQVLFHLREVLEAPIVFVVEGEKDVETLREYGFVATTNAGGAKAPWLPSYTETLAGREVILIPDADAPGRQRGLTVARALVGRVARLIVFEVEGAKDVTEWLAHGHSEIELIAQIESGSVSR